MTEGGPLARWRGKRLATQGWRAEFGPFAISAAQGDLGALSQLELAREQTRTTGFNRELLRLYELAVHAAIRDDVLTAEESKRLEAIGRTLGLHEWGKSRGGADPKPSDVLRTVHFSLWEELVIAQFNDGRLPTLANPKPMLNSGEVAHGAFSMALREEVTVKEYQGGSSGVSIPLGLGVRYRTSSTRGRTVVVGSKMEVVDRGILTVTSRRTLFTGEKAVLEFRHDKLVSVGEFKNGLRLGVSNRRATTLLTAESRQTSLSVAAALIAAAVGRANG